MQQSLHWMSLSWFSEIITMQLRLSTAAFTPTHLIRSTLLVWYQLSCVNCHGWPASALSAANRDLSVPIPRTTFSCVSVPVSFGPSAISPYLVPQSRTIFHYLYVISASRFNAFSAVSTLPQMDWIILTNAFVATVRSVCALEMYFHFILLVTSGG